MKPKYKISLDGSDITSNFNDRLLTINIVDLVGNEGDKLTIEVDDRDETIDVPQTGKSLEIFLGYEDTGMQSMGTYNIDKIGLHYRPSSITIHGTSVNMSTEEIKKHQNNNYENKSLADIANEVAGRNSLKAFVDPSIGTSKYQMMHQTDESDMHLLQRLARENNAIFKIAGGMLIVSKAGSALTSSGEKMGVVITPSLVKPGSVTVDYKDRAKFSAANAFSFNKDTWQREISSAMIGSGLSIPNTGSIPGATSSNGFFLRHPLLSKDAAQTAAEGRAAELTRNQASATATLAIGDPSVSASGDMTLQGFRAGIDGTYTINSVEHNYDSAGYTTKIDADNGSGDSGS